jgi:pimeloyl-ACP methyl ester carboxylesterase
MPSERARPFGLTRLPLDRAVLPHQPVLVFVHGAMDRGTSFDRVRRRFADFATVAYDRRGYASSVSLPFGDDPFADHVNDLMSVLDELGGSDGSDGSDELGGSDGPTRTPLVLIGHSAGSNVVMAAAQRLLAEPCDVRLLGAVVFEPPMPWAKWWPGNAGGSTIAAFEADGPEAAAESFMRRIVTDRVWERLPADTRAARRAEGMGLVADLTTLRGRPVQFDYSAIQIPVVVGKGEKSHDHQRRSSDETAALLPNAELVELKNHGHGAHSSDPEGFSGLIHRVLAHRPH